jgi:hypothetical protein
MKKKNAIFNGKLHCTGGLAGGEDRIWKVEHSSDNKQNLPRDSTTDVQVNDLHLFNKTQKLPN